MSTCRVCKGKHGFCKKCIGEILPFSKYENELETNPILKRTSHLSNLFNELNEAFVQEQEIGEDESDTVNKIECKYFDIEEFKNLQLNSKKSFSLFHLNVASLSLNSDDLHTILTATNFEFDIIGISETRIKNLIPSCSNLQIENHSNEDTPTESSAGGTRLYISKRLAYKRRNDLQLYKAGELESTFVEIINNNSNNTIVGCIYRHPSMSIKEFNDNFLETLFHNLSKESKKKIYLIGDFNIDLLKVNTHNQTGSFLDIVESNEFMPQILLPTRLTSRSKTLIDNIFVNHFNETTTSGNLTCTVSDHLPQFLVSHYEKSSIEQSHNIKVRNMKNFVEEDFIEDIKKLDWTQLLNTSRDDINHSFDTFISILNTLLDKHAPFKTMNKKELKLQQKPWISKGILCSIRKRDIIFRKLKKATKQTVKSNLHAKYKNYRNQIVLLTRLSKRNYYSTFFTTNMGNLRKTWEGIREIVSIKEKSKCTPNCIMSNGKNITNQKEIANNFNSFFSSIGNKIQNEIFSQHKSYSDFLKNSSQNSIFLTPTDPSEVASLISSLNTKKATGPNSIPSFIISKISKEVSIPLSSLINCSFVTGTFPTNLKVARIIPVHKQGSKLSVNNYRPISLLSNIHKIFEKIMYKRLYDFLCKQNSFYELQFGFRSKHSTTHALISLTEKIREAPDNNKYAFGIFIDLKKAFDTVDHNILLKKLEHYGVRGVPNEWFRSYLTGRKQFVTINGSDSKTIGVNIGVPQGSVLGPLLFLVYMNEIFTPQ